MSGVRSHPHSKRKMCLVYEVLHTARRRCVCTKSSTLQEQDVPSVRSPLQRRCVWCTKSLTKQKEDVSGVRSPPHSNRKMCLMSSTEEQEDRFVALNHPHGHRKMCLRKNHHVFYNNHRPRSKPKWPGKTLRLHSGKFTVQTLLLLRLFFPLPKRSPGKCTKTRWM